MSKARGNEGARSGGVRRAVALLVVIAVIVTVKTILMGMLEDNVRQKRLQK